MRNHCPLTSFLTLTSSKLFLILLDHSSLYHMLFIHCRLIIILSIYVWLTLTLAKVCPHSRLITQYIIIIRIPFPVFKDNSYYIQFFSLTINLNCAVLVLFYLNFPSSKNYDHIIHRLDAILSTKAKIILSM